MSQYNTHLLALAALLAAIAAAPAHGQSIRRAPAFADGDLVPAPAADWPTNGGDWYNRRYSPLTEINRDNVANLKGVWRTHLKGSGLGPQYSGEAQPIVYRGVAYIVTGANDVFAISVDSGEILWEYRANLDPANNAVCCGWTSRGVALGAGYIYVGQLDGKLVALDQRNGNVVWSTQAERWQEGYTITSAPLYYDGLVVTGFAGGERGIRGRVKAFNATDGSLAWTFYTIPGPGEVGHDTWPQDNEIWMDGGAPVWQTPAVDPELGLIYFSTGNPGPDYNGSVRAGDNLFSASIVAIDAKTGTYRWHFQQVHHDIWDYDSPAPVTLFDLQIDGVMRKGLAQASKTGWVYILDRTNGQPLIGIDERTVPQEPRQATAATQPHPRGDAFIPQSIPIAPEGARLVNQGRIFTPFWTEPVLIKPGVGGGANWPPSSYDPASGLLYVCAADRIWAYLAQEITDERPPEGAGYIAGGFGGFHLHSLGIFAALDMRTNKLVWQQHWSEPCYSGSVTTAGGLVFVGRTDGRLTALNSADGSKLWEFQTGAGMNAPATVFEHRGRQHVVAYSAGNLFAGSARGDSVWLFSLAGEMEPVPPAGALLTFAPGAGGPGNADNGKMVYDTACTFCHGEQGEGGHGGGPSLAAAGNVNAVLQIVSEGRNDMPPFGAGALTPEQIRDVSAYVAQKLTAATQP
ncbi:MAG TPA: PQQ-binding-like beta-propeller repeat protein [Gammaproteobacteria bacterium]|nr:PQQ-binding-like beta-propeller repeat protein [Gammaproteobacteria bacterium]